MKIKDKDFYDVACALVAITEYECCSYNFDRECDIADEFIKEYELLYGKKEV